MFFRGGGRRKIWGGGGGGRKIWDRGWRGCGVWGGGGGKNGGASREKKGEDEGKLDSSLCWWGTVRKYGGVGQNSL